MSLAIKYETQEDARLRLRNSVVLYKGAPVFLTDVVKGADGDGPFRVYMQELPMVGLKGKLGGAFARAVARGDEILEDAKRKFISSKHFDIAPFKMGYVNSPNGVFYCTRMPNRVQRQGLCGENFSAKTNKGTPVDFSTFLSCKEVPAMVAGDYPTFDRALKLLDKTESVAFDRDFSLQKDEAIPQLIFLFHKGIRAGAIMNGDVWLSIKHKCLTENLGELKVKVAA